jgi:hypothetical protein
MYIFLKQSLYTPWRRLGGRGGIAPTHSRPRHCIYIYIYFILLLEGLAVHPKLFRGPLVDRLAQGGIYSLLRFRCVWSEHEHVLNRRCHRTPSLGWRVVCRTSWSSGLH